MVAGAFDEDDLMVGFLFGMTGFVDGSAIHWSDMLAVHERARGRGIGQALKRHQRDTLIRRGVHHVNWTFDPLESRNAHLNFARLGVTSNEYVPDCYGESSSTLHAGLSTDRLIASWSLTSDRVRSRMEQGVRPPARDAFADVSIINPATGPDLELDNPASEVHLELDGPRLLLRIPSDIQAVKQRDRRTAWRWRVSTRAAFTAYLGRGFEVIELMRGGEDSYYLLERR